MDVRFTPLWISYPKVLWRSYRSLPKGQSLRHLFNVNPVFGPKDIFVFSKIALTGLLQSIGVRQPEYCVLESDEKSSGQLENLLQVHGWLVAKPEFGARSKGISILKDEAQLVAFLKSDRRRRYLVQAFVTGDELSIMFSRMPAGEIKARSIMRRSKVTVVGDGTSTIEQLASAVCEGEVLSAVLKRHDGEEVLPDGEHRLLSELGTYRLGASYEPVSERPSWVSDVETRLSGVDGLNYCRVDVICNPETSEYWVLELNGSHAEPLEAYQDPDNSAKFFDTLGQSIRQRIEIGKAVEDQGQSPPTRLEILSFASSWFVDYLKRQTRWG